MKVYPYLIRFPCGRFYRQSKPLVPKPQDGDLWVDFQDVYWPGCLSCEDRMAVLAGVAICKGTYSYSPAGWDEKGEEIA